MATAASSTTGTWAEGHIGSVTTVKLGPAAVRFPAVHLPDIQADPEVGPTSVRFVQTVGGRMGLPTPRPVPHKPFAQLWPSIAWTTLALTINADGSATHEVVGASPFPRHWFYDHDGKLIEKSATIDFRKWFNESYGDHTPWGDTDSEAVVTAVGSALGAPALHLDHAGWQEAEDPEPQGGRLPGRAGQARL